MMMSCFQNVFKIDVVRRSQKMNGLQFVFKNNDYNYKLRILCQQVSNGHWFDPGRTLLEASLAQW